MLSNTRYLTINRLKIKVTKVIKPSRSKKQNFDDEMALNGSQLLKIAPNGSK